MQYTYACWRDSADVSEDPAKETIKERGELKKPLGWEAEPICMQQGQEPSKAGSQRVSLPRAMEGTPSCLCLQSPSSRMVLPNPNCTLGETEAGKSHSK